ncbi:MAG: outer membrane protein assembly factor BamA [bacterium]
MKNRGITASLLFCLLFSICHLVFSVSSSAESSFVERIEISGNRTVKTKKILKEISVRAGDICSDDLLLNDVKKIYEMAKFENVTVSVSTSATGSVVMFEVVEKPRLRKFEFVGNNNVSSGKLKEKLTLSKGDYFSISDIMNEIRAMQDVYKEEGFSKAKITHFVGKPDDKDRSPVTFYMEEGNKIVVRKLSIFGVRAYSVKKIKGLCEVGEKKIFNPDKFKDDITKIEEFYKNSGFARLEVSKPFVYYGESGESVDISLFIYEDRKYKINDVNFSRTSVKTADEFEKFMKEAKFRPGKIYAKKDEDKVIDLIQNSYAEVGYLKTLIEPKRSFHDGLMDIGFEIFEGEQIFINGIYIEGNTRTKDFVIKREIHVKEGDPFKLSEVRESQRRIFNLGFFSDVQIIPTDTHLPAKMDLTFKVQDQQTGMLSMGAGYSSSDRLVGTMQVSETNFRGHGQKLSLMWEFGKRRKNYNLSFTEPYFFGRNLSFTSSIYDIERLKEYESATEHDNYDEHKRGGSIGFGKRYGVIYKANVGYAYEAINLEDVEASYMIKQRDIAKKRGRTSSFSTSFTRDTRDYFWDPSRGSLQKVSEELATAIFGGQNYFHRERLQFSHFLPLVWRFVFVTNIEGGAVHGYGSTKDVPVYERFYVGGGETIRGYKYRAEIGPPEGGRFMSVNNFELKFPLVRENKQTILQWAFFFDIGGCWDNYNDIEWSYGIDEKNFKRGWGMGIRFKIPAFPVRLDWAKGLDHRKGESETQWYFTIGDIFW